MRRQLWPNYYDDLNEFLANNPCVIKNKQIREDITRTDVKSASLSRTREILGYVKYAVEHNDWSRQIQIYTLASINNCDKINHTLLDEVKRIGVLHMVRYVYFYFSRDISELLMKNNFMV